MDFVFEGRLQSYAAALTYIIMLALLPTLFLLVSLYGLVDRAPSSSDILIQLKGVMPDAVAELVRDQLQDLTAPGRQVELSIGAVVAVLLSLWAISAVFRLAMQALNMIYKREETRSLAYRFVLSLALSLLGAVLGAIALGLLAIGPHLLADLIGLAGGGQSWQDAAAWIRWPLIIVMALSVLSLLYRYGPDGEKEWHFASIGACTALTIWIVFSQLLSWYLSNFGAFNKTWGSLAGVIIFLLYINWSSAIMLIGAKIDYMRRIKKEGKAKQALIEKARLEEAAAKAQAEDKRLT